MPPKKKISYQTTKRIKKMKDETPRTGAANVKKINIAGKMLDVEGSIKKDKEVKEKDVFDFGSNSQK